jgi:hypothetical protein
MVALRPSASNCRAFESRSSSLSPVPHADALGGRRLVLGPKPPPLGFPQLTVTAASLHFAQAALRSGTRWRDGGTPPTVPQDAKAIALGTTRSERPGE